MPTRIFSVEYGVTEKYNGKSSNYYSEHLSVVAKDGENAIEKTKTKVMKPYSYVNEKKKKITITKHGFEVLSLKMTAQSD